METKQPIEKFFEDREKVIKENCDYIEGEFIKFWYYAAGGPLDGDFDLWIKLDNKEIKQFMGHGYGMIQNILENYRAGGKYMKGDHLKIWHICSSIRMIENLSLNERRISN